MPPPLPLPSSQGSRAGMITALVISITLLMLSAFLAFKFHTEWQAEMIRHKDDLEALKPAINVSPGPSGTVTLEKNNAEVLAVLLAAKAHPLRTGIEEAIDQRNAVSKLITGNANATVDGVRNDTENMLADVRETLKKAVPAIPVKIDDDNLLANLKALADQVVKLSGDVATAQAATKTANDATAAEIASHADALKKLNDQIASVTKEKADTITAGGERDKVIAANLATQDEKAKKEITDAEQKWKDMQVENGKVTALLTKANDALNKSLTQIAKFRVNPSRSLLQPAGFVTRVPGNNTAYINFGEGQQIWPGLTFEVYDKKTGLPSLTAPNPDSPDSLAAGKGSIEVIRILPDTCECRIIHEEKDMHVVEGDLILNLIYNTHTKFAFVVYGDFDLGNTGQIVPGDAETIRRLVTQWGGRVMTEVNIETDFLVLGKAPVVHTPPDNPTAVDLEKIEAEKAALAKYDAKVNDAMTRNIPILNQNRFLYFIGYYDQKTR